MGTNKRTPTPAVDRPETAPRDSSFYAGLGNSDIAAWIRGGVESLDGALDSFGDVLGLDGGDLSFGVAENALKDPRDPDSRLKGQQDGRATDDSLQAQGTVGNTTVGASWGKKGPGGSLSHSHEEGGVKDTRAISLGTDGAGMSRGRSWETELAPDETVGGSWSAGANYSRTDGLGAKAGGKLTEEHHGYSNEMGASAELKKGELTLGLSDETKRADGSGHGEALSLSGDLDKASLAYGSQQTDVDGNTSGSAFTGGVDWGNEQVSVGYSTGGRDKEGNNTSSFGMNGAVGPHGASGQVAAGDGPFTFALGGGVEARMEEPREVDGRWAVAWSRSGGLQGSIGGEAGIGSGSFGITDQTTTSGVRWFSSKDEADAFRADGASLAAPPASADAILAMAPGDSLGTIDSTGADASLGIDAQTLDIGVKGSAASSQGVHIVRGEGDTVRVERQSSESLGGGGSLGAPLVSLGAYLRGAEEKTETWSFDLSSDAGKDAYEAYIATGERPRAGAERIETGMSSTSGSSTDIGFGGIDFSSFGWLTDSVSWAQDGEKTETTEGGDGTTAGFDWLGWSVDQRYSLGVTQVDDAEQQQMLARSVVDCSGTFQSQAGILQAMGEHANSQTWTREEEAAGTYTVDTVFADDAMATIMADMDLSGMASDDQRLLLAEIVQEEGWRGIERLREHAGEGASEDFVGLEGDDYLTGYAGHLQTEARIASIEASLDAETDPIATYKDAHELYVWARDRQRALSDRSQYAGLPHEARALEMKRTEELLARLGALDERATAALPQDAISKADPDARDAAVTRATEQRADTEAVYAELRRTRLVHDGWGMGLRASGLRENTISGFGYLGEGGAYAEADAAMAHAEEQLRKAHAAESKADGFVRTDTSDAASYSWSEAARAYEEAAAAMDLARQHYDSIEVRHADHEDHGLWTKGFGKDLPEGL